MPQVRDEFDTRMARLSPVFEIITGNTNTTNTSASELIRKKAYGEYEWYDIALSRLIVESLLSPSYRETIKTHFSHHDNFKELPGQVYFMMVLNACNKSAAIDIESAEIKFNELSLSILSRTRCVIA